MRILMVVPRFPYPPDRGDTVRSWGIISGLALEHEIWLAAVDTCPPTADQLATVQQYCRRVAVFPRSAWRRLLQGGRGLLGGRSLTEAYHADERVGRLLRTWAGECRFDALLTYSSAVAPLVRGIPAARRVLDLCDVDSVKWESYARRSRWPRGWLYRTEARRVSRLESRSARDHDLCLLVNSRERSKFRERVPHVCAEVLPTTIDVEHYAGDPDVRLPHEPVVGMVGSMFYPPNVQAVNWFGRYVWPRVQQVLPAARWLIVGGRPTRSVRAWGAQRNVTVTGYVEDVRSYLHSMRVFVNPVEGDLGVQSKLVVALAAGRPAVVTPQAAAGIEYDDPPPFIIAGAPSGFADAVIRLLRDDAHARALSARARSVAWRNYRIEGQVARITSWLNGTPVGPARSRPDNAILPAATVGARP